MENVVEKVTKKYNYTKKTGRPSKYKPEYCEEIIKFFDIELSTPVLKKKIIKKDGEVIEEYDERANNMRFLSQYARSIGVTTTTMLQWTEEYPEFLEAYNKAKELQEEHLVGNALHANFNPFFAFQTAKNIFGWRDKIETEHSGDLNLTLKGILNGSARSKDDSRSVEAMARQSNN